MESPYEKHFDTNYVPAVDEAREIQTIVAESAKEITDLDTQIKKLQEQLDVIQAKKERIQTFSDKHKALLSPVRQLTRDILEEIFLACLPTNRNPCMSTSDAPMLLTRICGSWRRTAHSTPRLWAKIHIPLPVIALETQAAQKDLIKHEEQIRTTLELREIAAIEWLNRSYACPLSISIYQTLGVCSAQELSHKHNAICDDLRELHVSFMRNVIVPHRKRWHDLDIYVADDTLCRFLDLGLTFESLPMLKTLHVGHQVNFSAMHKTLPYKWTDLAALLSTHITSATLASFQIKNSDLPFISRHAWGNLTELNLKLDVNHFSTPVNVIQFAGSILRHCHSLKSFKLIVWANVHYDTPDLHQAEDIILQHLTTLTLSLPMNPASLALAKILYLPSLNDLGFHFSSQVENGQEFVQEMITSLLRASENLHVLRVYTPYCASSSDNLAQILQCTPALRCLEFSSKTVDLDRWPPSYYEWQKIYIRNSVNDSLLEALTPTNRSDSDIICPKLEVLMCDNQLLTGITESCLKDFIMSRQNDERVPSLQRISVYIDEPKEQQDSNANKIPLGADSAVYFKKKLPSPYSPFEGIKDYFTPFREGIMERYNEL